MPERIAVPMADMWLDSIAIRGGDARLNPDTSRTRYGDINTLVPMPVY